MLKEVYEELEVELIRFEATDVIVTSNTKSEEDETPVVLES